MRLIGRNFGLVCLSFAAAWSSAATAQNVLLLPDSIVRELAGELSGENAHRIVQHLSQHHRMRGSRGFSKAVAHIRSKLEEYGLDDVEVWRFPTDGERFYGTQRSRPAWDADFAELWELKGQDGRRSRHRRIASWDDRPVTLAQDSTSGSVREALLVDVGAGTRPDDYRGKPIEGNLVLTSSQPGSVYDIAVVGRGAAGIVSYAQNQRSAWWKEDENLVRWGHLNTFPQPNTFAFMVSLKQARSWKERMHRGEEIRLQAEVRAGQHPGSYDIVTGVIRGADPKLADQEIVYSCHLDHQRPGANDNASGCATILEVARTLSKLIRDKRIPRPARTLRFVWPPEIEGTMALLTGRPGFPSRIAAAIHLDMVGGGPVTKARFHVTRSPKSLPSFINDVAETWARFVNRQSAQYADTGNASYPFASPEGGKEPLEADMVDLTMGSDHQVYSEGSFRIPTIYMNDWPDRYIHTHKDRLANIDPTKLLRAGFIASASGYFLASLKPEEAKVLSGVLRRAFLRETSVLMEKLEQVPARERTNLIRHHFEFLKAKSKSLERFLKPGSFEPPAGQAFLDNLRGLLGRHSATESASPQSEAGRVVYRRQGPKGPMSVFGYNYLDDKLNSQVLPRPRLLGYQGLWGGGAEYAYEALNLVDGLASAARIRDDLSATYGPVPLDLVTEYLETLHLIGILETP